MAPRGGNDKKESGRAKKAENVNKKKEVEENNRELKESDKWSAGAKSKNTKDEREEKRQQELRKKEELKALLAAEEAATASKPKAAPKAGGAKKKPVAPRPAGPGAIAAGGGVAGALAKAESAPSEPATTVTKTPEKEVESFSARGLDGALELMDAVTAKTDKASKGQAAAGIEKHPERRFKAAFAAYEERELPNLKEEHPGLRRNQYGELLYKNFKKSPDNPFNQATIAYDATKEEKIEVLDQKQQEVEERLRERLRLDGSSD